MTAENKTQIGYNLWAMFTRVVSLLYVLLFASTSFAQGNLLTNTRVVTFLGERYGVFYQWSDVDGNLPMETLAEQNLEISERVLKTEGRIKSPQHSFYNTVEAATARITPAMISKNVPLYLNELFISERELDYATGKFPNARNNYPYIAYVQSEMDAAKALRKIHQFTGSGLTSEELADINHRAQMKLNRNQFTWGKASQIVGDYFDSRVNKILGKRNYPMSLPAMKDDGIVKQMAQSSKDIPSKYQDAYNETWDEANRAAQTPAKPNNILGETARLGQTNLDDEKTIQRNTGSSLGAKGKIGGANNVLNFAGIALAFIDPKDFNMYYSDPKGVDCEDAAAKSNRLICEWENVYNPINHKVQCTVGRKIVKNQVACDLIYDAMIFTINDEESKRRFKDSGMLNENGVSMNGQSIESFAEDFRQKFKVEGLKIGKDFTTGDLQIN